MNKLHVKAIIERLRTNLYELENELKSDPESYLRGVEYEDVLEYYQTNDNDGEEGL